VGADEEVDNVPDRVSRRDFLRLTAKGAAGAALALLFDPIYLEAAATPPFQVDSPLSGYPNRDWESVYRDLWKEDSRFVFTCSPNDTHNCLLWAHVKNGVVVRISPTYGYGQATDLYGNKASHRWDPRACQKGLVMARKFYGDRRIRKPKVRKGFLEWADAGFPRDPETGAPLSDLRRRGEDSWLEIGWDKAFDLAAKTMVNVAETYSGEKGAAYLRKQGYDPAMIESDHYGHAGTRTMKLRGGMPLLGVTRIFGFYRFANMLALLDSHVRKVGPDEAKGSRGWDNYTWHTDLPPGHPMVTGHQTVEFELWAVEHAQLLVTWGMNWISTKMPDGHWIGEARLKGTRVINISTDYQSTSNKADEVLVIRPGTDAALALGACKVVIDEKLYDEEHVRHFTDLPLLVRMDTLQLLRGRDIIAGYRSAGLANTRVYRTDGKGAPAEKLPPNYRQEMQLISDRLRSDWDDFVLWDRKRGGPAMLSRDQVGEHSERLGHDPDLTGVHTVTLADGSRVEVRTVFSLIKQYLDENCDLQTISELTWAPKEAIASLARQVAANRQKTLHGVGMGPNHYFNADLKDRAILLLAALTDGIGHIGGNVGSYAGNYRGSVFNGVPHYIAEDPFDIELDPAVMPRTRTYYKGESAHFYNYGDRPLRVGNKLFTGATHMPSPSKLVWFGNSNSILGNAKWHFDVVHNTLPRIEAIFCNEWWWTGSCEYADLVFGVDAWSEFPYPDMTASCTNPFLCIFPAAPRRNYDTRYDLEVIAGVAKRLGELTGDRRMIEYFQFMHDRKPEVYLQRILDYSTSTRGYRIEELHEKARRGVPVLMNFRTYPRQGGWEQRNESKPWYNKTGRLEFYREEPEFIEYGENLPVWREPVDSTFLDPNAILARPHPAIRPKQPADYGLAADDRSVETRQVRNVTYAWSDLKLTKHPLQSVDEQFRFIFISPKYRHGTHTTPVDIDWMAVYFGPFGDIYRHDKRKPWVGEGYLEMNPQDAKKLGIEDGDYIWMDSDPSDRPYRGWKQDDPFYQVARCMARARYNNAVPPGVTRMWFHMYGATKGSVRGQQTRPDGLAKNPETNYQSFFRHGSHQSGTRAWLRPTLLTDTLVRKPYFGHVVGTGFEVDIHAANGAPKESTVKVERAEPGGWGGETLWLPAREGLRPTYESEAMARYLKGGFVRKG
jgi:nitrate reductase / nitrite oxidoreductase, alpha subunit